MSLIMSVNQSVTFYGVPSNKDYFKAYWSVNNRNVSDICYWLAW